MNDTNRDRMVLAAKGPILWGLSLTLVLAAVSLAACGEATPTRVSLPMPTVAIGHRDAFALMPSVGDLGGQLELKEMYRMDSGRGWGDQATRLSGYRAIYQDSQDEISQIECQVECYLSVPDAQSAYRAYKEQLSLQLDAAYDLVGESEEDALGDWNWVFKVQSNDQQVVHYLFLRDNVLVEMAFAGQSSPTLPGQAVRYARSVDQTIYEH